jgi:hypothetical protein
MRVQRTSRRIIKALDPIYNVLEPLSYPLIRFVAGAMMVPHGYAKVFGGIEGTTKFFASVGLEPALTLAWYVGLLELDDNYDCNYNTRWWKIICRQFNGERILMSISNLPLNKAVIIFLVLVAAIIAVITLLV